MSSELGLNQAAKARFWPWLSYIQCPRLETIQGVPSSLASGHPPHSPPTLPLPRPCPCPCPTPRDDNLLPINHQWCASTAHALQSLPHFRVLHPCSQFPFFYPDSQLNAIACSLYRSVCPESQFKSLGRGAQGK
jgi:hypothetical protein